MYNISKFDCYFKLQLKTVFFGVFEQYDVEYLRGYLVYIIIFLVPNCGVGGFRYVVRIVGEVLRMCSNLIVGVYSLIALCIECRSYLENLGGKMMVIFDLLMVTRGVIMFLVWMIMLYLRKDLLVYLLSLVLLVGKIVLSNVVVIRRCWGGGGQNDFHGFVQMLVLNQDSLKGYLVCYVVK